MLYQIIFKYIAPESGQEYTFKGIKEGCTPGEATYYFLKQYQHHEIEIQEVKELNI